MRHVAVVGRQPRFGDAMDEPLVLEPMRDELRDGDERDARALARTPRAAGRRAVVPSSFKISQITPAGSRPARRARSTAVSVWPTRWSTPPSRARSGNTCPPWRRSRGAVPDRRRRESSSRDPAALMPVVTPKARRRIDAHRVRRAVVVEIGLRHRRQAERVDPLAGEARGRSCRRPA